MRNRLSNPGGIHVTHLRSLATAMAVLLLATPLIAQSSAGAPAARDTSQRAAPAVLVPAASPTVVVLQNPSLSKAPSWANAVSMAPDTTARRPFVLATESGAKSQNSAMLVVGGAGVLVGAIVGGKAGTVVMIGGTAVGLIGLWRYLR
jgi:hypothetical protein